MAEADTDRDRGPVRDLYTQEEHEGPTNRPREGQRSLSELQTEKVQRLFDRRDKQMEERRQRAEEVNKLQGFRPAPKNTVRIKPAARYSVKGVIDVDGGRITEEAEVERTPWILRRIRDGSLEVVAEQPEQPEQPQPEQPPAEPTDTAEISASVEPVPPAPSPPPVGDATPVEQPQPEQQQPAE